jgi:hypothetical protein
LSHQIRGYRDALIQVWRGRWRKTGNPQANRHGLETNLFLAPANAKVEEPATAKV